MRALQVVATSNSVSHHNLKLQLAAKRCLFMNIHEHWRESLQTCPTFQCKFQPPPAKFKQLTYFLWNCMYIHIHNYTHINHITCIYINIYIYLFISCLSAVPRLEPLEGHPIYIWFDANRNNVFPLDCSFKPSEFGWFQVWTVSPGFVGEEHNHCY